MDPIQNKETFFEKITNKFRKKKTINITTSNPYDIHITRLQVDNQRLADAIKKKPGCPQLRHPKYYKLI